MRVPREWFGRCVPALVVLICVALLASSAMADDSKLGVIDSQRIFNEYQAARDAEATFQEDMRQWQTELEGVERELISLQERIRSQAVLLSEAKLGELQAELEQKSREYEARKNEILDPEQGQAILRNQELSAPINDQITTVVERLGAEGDYAMIIDLATVNVVYLAAGVDLTDQVLEELQKGTE